MKTNLLCATSALALLLAQAANAQDVTDLGELIISGGFTPIESGAFGRSYSVISADQIASRGITSVQDILRAIPGISVNGAGDSYTQIRIRGAESTHTLILIDGIEATGGDGEYILTGLETANIERIEVLRGPQSVYYGSNASAGVINIITKKGNSGSAFNGSVEFGNNSTRAAMHTSMRNEKGGVSLNLSQEDNAGYDYSGSNGEKDGIKRSTLQFSADYLVMENLKLGLTFRKSNEEYDLDGNSWVAAAADEYVIDDATQFSERTEQLFQVFGEHTGFEGRVKQRLSYEKTNFDQFYNGFAPSKAQTEAAKYLMSYGLDGTANEAKQVLNMLVEWERDTSSTSPDYERETTSYALEYRGNFDNGFDVQLGARFDNNKIFENATTWNAGLSYTFANGLRVHGSAGKGVVNPSYFELYAAADYGYTYYAGNNALQPEENTGFDLGIEMPVLQGRGTIDVTYFNEKLKGEIEAYATGETTDSGGTVYSYRNQDGNSTREGVEVAAQVQATEALDLRLSYTYLDAKNPDGSVEIRRPKHELLLSASLNTFGGRGSVNADLRHVAGNYDTQFFGSYATEKLKDYTTVDVSANYRLNGNVTLTGRVTNLFDEDYSDTWGYAKRGRAFFIGLNTSF